MIESVIVLIICGFIFAWFFYQRVKWSNLLVFASVAGNFDKADKMFRTKKFFLSKESVELHNQWFEFWRLK